MKTAKILSTVLAAAALLGAVPAVAQSQPSRLRCIDVKNIQDTVTRDDGKTLNFRLRDGTTVVNTLSQPCDGLKFGGFTWVTPPNGEICEDSQTLRLAVTGEICRLGKFGEPVRGPTIVRR